MPGSCSDAFPGKQLVCSGASRKVTGNSSWYLGLVGVPPPLQQQQVEPSSGSGSNSSSSINEEDPLVARANVVCSALTSLSPEQVEVCMKHPNIIYSVANGAYKGIQECQYQFRNERWNCTTNEEDENVFGYILKTGSKETAFIYAVTSAGVVHAVTQGCSAGDLAECSCDAANHGKSTPEGWKWGGCSDNIDYGLEFARKFVDAPEQLKPYDKNEKFKNRVVMNLHNNEAGRQIVQSLMKMHCRCHGVSGSCELKTCWKTIPPFSEIGDTLKKKYNEAVLLRTPRNSAKHRSKRNRARARKSIPADELIHVSKSPNFCKHNQKKGILGTKGRECSKSSTGNDSCSTLCCGRGYNTQELIRQMPRNPVSTYNQPF
ncbi:hypothetical protein V9T40_008325 [Parthenolecanium corni]|uniref:Protein Wnt n=1 Tax=Parthenolecanium corni TaxID=536013 RepID=A0AAN9TY84_9HEMI